MTKILQNRYQILHRMGKGGIGEVYAALDLRFGSTMALKRTLVDRDFLLKAFEKEARLLNSVRHAALPVVTDYFSEEDDVYLVMRFIPGEDLGELLKRKGGPFSVKEV